MKLFQIPFSIENVCETLHKVILIYLLNLELLHCQELLQESQILFIRKPFPGNIFNILI